MRGANGCDGASLRPEPFPGDRDCESRRGQAAQGPVTISSMSEAAEETPGPEDLKIINLARAARARVESAEGAAVRDETGRTYAAAAVALPSLQLSALHLAVAMAASSGAGSLEAAAYVSDGSPPEPASLAAVRELGPNAVVFCAAPDGTLRAILRP